jgi:hypothetical protein
MPPGRHPSGIGLGGCIHNYQTEIAKMRSIKAAVLFVQNDLIRYTMLNSTATAKSKNKMTHSIL